LYGLRTSFSFPLYIFNSGGLSVLPRALRDIRDGLMALAYPEWCRICSAAVESWDDGIACAHCWEDPNLTKLLNGSLCAKCGSPLSRPILDSQQSPRDADTRLCGTCASLPFTFARAAGIYSGALEASVLFLKVTPHICSRLRVIICKTLSDHRHSLASEIVMPVPLHYLRERQRGFNQAAIIARLVSREFNLRLDERSMLRTRPTERHRAGLDAADRARSVERAFEVMRPRLIDGMSILLVDDVYTTGSTICAATQKLLEAGARQVTVLTIARVGDR
jgi:ComF family protein